MNESSIFPKLKPGQLGFLRKHGAEMHFKKGDYLIREGDKNYDLYILLDGDVGIYDPTNDNYEIATHTAGEFTGDINILSERSAIFNAVANTDTQVIKIAHDDLKEVISKNSELSDLLLKAFLLRRIQQFEKNIGAIKLVGSRYSPDTFRIREFLSKNHMQYNWIDLEEDPHSDELLRQFQVEMEETPILINSRNEIYRNPSIQQIAECTGVASHWGQDVYDVIVVGAGPAGLAASVYGASEGLRVITIDEIGPGGQAGTSSKIENYLGFPTGISGSELANRAYIQAQKFGCNISIPHRAKKLTFKDNVFQLLLESGQVILGSTVIACTGAHYKRIPLKNIDYFEGRGIYYGATQMEARTCKDQEVIVVGGGNSAGQAAIFLSKHASHVHLLIRGNDLKKSMSNYLIQRIDDEEKITLHTSTEVTELSGNGSLEKVKISHAISGKDTLLDIRNLFLFIGAEPCNNWLKDIVCTDKKGFIVTGRDLTKQALSQYQWPLLRDPFSLETCVPGLFAVGDIRSGSTKRVASAVGEGSIVVSQIHQFLS